MNELLHLLDTTADGPTRLGMTGPERGMLYRVAVETGLRANELRSLRVSSFDWVACTVTVQAAYSKHRRQDMILLKPETAEALKAVLSGKTPNARAFAMPKSRNATIGMFRADLEAAGIAYRDEAGRYADFHSLRHATGSLLSASGATPKASQSVMRHRDIQLTMNYYTHLYRGAEAEAVAKLPDLSVGRAKGRKTRGGA